MSGLTGAERERRKFGTEVPHEPTDEFVVQAFAEGASRLWPDSRDPGWHATFRRWLAARDDATLTARLAAVEALADEPPITDCEWGCGDELRAALGTAAQDGEVGAE